MTHLPLSIEPTPGAPRRGGLRGEPVRAAALWRGGQLRRRQGPGLPVQLQGRLHWSVVKSVHFFLVFIIVISRQFDFKYKGAQFLLFGRSPLPAPPQPVPPEPLQELRPVREGRRGSGLLLVRVQGRIRGQALRGQAPR